MAGQITALEPQKHSKTRVNVYLDGEFAFGLAEIEAARLRVGQYLSEADMAALRTGDEIARAHEKALDYLSYRPRSEAELTRALRQREFPEPVIAEVVERLKRVELVDDVAFARFWVENREQFRPRGQRALAQELRDKGISRVTIETVLSDFDEAAAAAKIATEQARRLAHLPLEKFQRQLSGRLARRGFSYDLIQELVTRFSSPDSHTDEDKEY